MCSSLAKAAGEAVESGRTAEGKVLWLLADACLMMLRPESTSEPFGPILPTRDGDARAATPGDFSEDDLVLFSDILREVDDVWLRARLADLLWLLEAPRDHKKALFAIDSYRAIPLDKDTWLHDGQECWQRAIVLALLLREGAGDRLAEMQSAIVKSFDEAGTEDRYWALWLAQLLAKNRLAREKALDIATKLDAMAQEFVRKGNLRCARDYYGSASEWFADAGDMTKAVEATVAVAESWETEACAQLSLEKPSYSQAAGHFENAIQTFRTIPGPYRYMHRVDDRVSELYRKMNEAGERAPEELRVIQSAPLDLSDVVERARSAVKGKTTLDALKGLAEVASGVQFKESRRRAEKTLDEHPLLAAFPATHISRSGRVIAKRPGGIGDADSEEYEVNVWAQMIRDYQLHINLTVRGQILPALDILGLEHRLSEIDFSSIALRSPIVPLGRERLFGRALFAGVERDFPVALHLLVPQIEQMVRFHLKASGARTTTLSQSGIEHEIGLSGLMDQDAADKIFGEDLAFELRALLCDSLGPNLRNEVAHGLLDDRSSQSAHSVYAWWFALHLTFVAFWNSARRPRGVDGELHDDG